MRREWLPHCANLDKLETLKVLRDGRCVAFSKLNHTGLIDAAEALKDHSGTDKGFTLGFGSLRLVGGCLSVSVIKLGT